jgi:PAS domain-containing protein
VYRELFENSGDACFLMDSGGLRDCSRAFLDRLGFADKSDLLLRHLAALSTPVQPDGTPSDSRADAVIERACREMSHRFDWSFRRADGTDLVCPSRFAHGTSRDTRSFTAYCTRTRERDGSKTLCERWRVVSRRRRVTRSSDHWWNIWHAP